MKKEILQLKKKVIFFAALSFLVISDCVSSVPITDTNTIYLDEFVSKNNPMIHADGTGIVDGKGNPIKLYGVLLEGWLMWNGPLFGAGLTSETKITNRLEKMAGKEETEKFRTAIYENFITEKDIEMIADFGFNVVRVPFNHTVLEDENPIEAYTAIGWKYLDNLMDWCEKYKVYVVLDFHSLPGGQGSFVSDPEFINVWLSQDHQQKTIDIWRAIANRYKDRQIIAGYDLINEPDPMSGKDLVNFYKKIITAIREVDKSHMIILEGTHFASDFSMFKEPLDSNQAYSFHSYNFITDETDKKNIEKISKIAIRHNVPLWNGEFGAHKLKWVKEELKLYEDSKYPINGWIFWPWKRDSEESTRFHELGKISTTEEWKKVALGIADFFGPDKKITPEMAKKAMSDFIESSKAENIVINKEMAKALKEAISNEFNIKPEITVTENHDDPNDIQTEQTTNDSNSLVKSIKTLDPQGGRVAVSPNGLTIAYDKRGSDGYFDIWTMNIDGSNKNCLSCDYPDLPTRNVGQPAWHPSGNYLIVQVEKQEHPEGIASVLSANPGAGIFNDLWIMHFGGAKRAYVVNEVPNGRAFGVLHPHFSKDGKKVSWSQMYKTPNVFKESQLAGIWKLKVADVDIAADGVMSLKKIQSFQPGEEVIYENHGFSPDGEKVIFTSNITEDRSIHTCDIYTLDLETQQLNRLTDTGYNEHAQYSPDGKKIIWMSTNGNKKPEEVKQVSYTDWWIMNADGSDKKRLTYFNKKGHPHFVLWGTCAADYAWLPDGSGFIGYYFTSSILNFKEVVVKVDFN